MFMLIIFRIFYWFIGVDLVMAKLGTMAEVTNDHLRGSYMLGGIAIGVWSVGNVTGHLVPRFLRLGKRVDITSPGQRPITYWRS